MTVATGIFVYLVTWWIVLFAVLPWGVRPVDDPEPGHVESAPARPRLLLKFAVTTGIAAILWVVIFAVIESDIISFQRWSRSM